jgi:hypothetical protein
METITWTSTGSGGYKEEEILATLENLKTKYVVIKDYERAAKVREVIKSITEKTFIERLEQEEKELSEKLSKIDDFIENNPAYEFVGDVQWVLLDAQRNAMMSYLHILQHRIGDLIQKQ